MSSNTVWIVWYHLSRLSHNPCIIFIAYQIFSTIFLFSIADLLSLTVFVIKCSRDLVYLLIKLVDDNNITVKYGFGMDTKCAAAYTMCKFLLQKSAVYSEVGVFAIEWPVVPSAIDTQAHLQNKRLNVTFVLNQKKKGKMFFSVSLNESWWNFFLFMIKYLFFFQVLQTNRYLKIITKNVE